MSRRNFIEHTNPLRGLAPSSVASALEAALLGDMARVQWMFYLIEQSDPDLLAIVERTISAISEMDWDAKGDAEHQRAGLGDAYNKIENLQAAINHLLLAEFRGFSVCQLQDDDGNPSPPGIATRIECLPHWCFVRDGLRGQFKWNADARSTTFDAIQGEPLDPIRDHLLIHTVDRPIDRIALGKFLRGNFAIRAWADYIEKVANDGVFIVEPEGLEDETKRIAFANASKDLRDGGGGSLPHGSQVVFANTLRGSAPFDSFLRYLREQLVIAATGGMLTMLASPTGIGQGASDAHTETFRTIASKKSRDISEVFQRHFDKPFIQRRWPNEPINAYFELAYRKDRDIAKMVEQAVQLSSVFELDRKEWSDITGYTLSQKREREVMDDLQVRNRAEVRVHAARERLSLAQAEIENVAEAFAVDLAPLRERIEALVGLSEQDFYNGCRALLEELPTLIPENPVAADALAEIFTAEFFNGMADAAAVADPGAQS